MIVKATMLLACIAHYGQGIQWSSWTLQLAHDKKFFVELSGGKLILEARRQGRVTVVMENDKVIKSFEIKRRNQYIKEMHFKCRSDYGFWCGRSTYGTGDLVSGADLKKYPWAIGSTTKCTDEKVSEYCIRCNACNMGSNQIDCSGYRETMNCSSTQWKEKCGAQADDSLDQPKYKCKSIPALMNPGCIHDGCVGTTWKTSDIQMDGVNCRMPHMNFRMQMKLWKQGTPPSPVITPNHVQVITFRGELHSSNRQQSGDLFSIHIKYEECENDGCKIRLGYVKTHFL